MFKNRREAGQLLARELMKYKDEPVVVIAIPRGGLPLGAEVADALGAPLDVALTKKIGHPFNREYAIGAVSLDQVVVNRPGDIDPDYIAKETARLRDLLQERHELFHRYKPPADVKGKTVIIIDDGIATGNTLRVTIALVAAGNPGKIVVAIPVAPPSAVERLRAMPEVAAVTCLETPWDFQAVGQFYEDFRPVSDAEALRIFEGGTVSGAPL